MAGFWDEEKLLTEMEKTGNKTLKFRKTSKDGKTYLEISEWYYAKKDKQERMKKGITIPYDLVGEFGHHFDMAKEDILE